MQEREQQHRPPNRVCPPSVKDDISIAFTRTQYPTPYTDHSIPGSKPGHRLRHLGRQHQPEDVLYNHLSHALVAHPNSVGTSEASTWTGTASHPAPPGGNYILHTKNAGKRHYDEASGLYSEQPWQPSKRIAYPIEVEQRPHVPHRRGRGIFNLQDGFLHPDAEEALQKREQLEERRRLHGGRARVDGPTDHDAVDLGLAQWTERTAAPAEKTVTGASPSSAVAAADTSSKAAITPSPATRVAPYKDLNETTGCALLPSTGSTAPLPRRDRVAFEAMEQQQHARGVRQAWRTKQHLSAVATTRAADAQVVRELPNW